MQGNGDVGKERVPLKVVLFGRDKCARNAAETFSSLHRFFLLQRHTMYMHSGYGRTVVNEHKQ
jgi:hypothetical protein